MRLSIGWILILFVGASLWGQSEAAPPAPDQAEGTPAAGPPPQSRADEVQRSRELKSRNLAQDVGSRLEQRIIRLRRNKVFEDLTGPPDGFGLAFGGLAVSQGFAAGVQFRKRDIWDGRLHFRATARASARKAYLVDFTASLPHLANDHMFFDLRSYHFDYPNIQYYGPGPNSDRNGRSVFRLENTGVEIKPGLRLAPGLTLGAVGSFLAVNVGHGDNSELAPTEAIYGPSTTPGIDHQSSFLQSGGFLQFDWRDYPGEATRGGNYKVQYEVVSDRDLHLGSFNRLDLEAQQYIPFFAEKRVLALRGRTILTDPRRGQRVPFYLQPTLGGSDSLRGYRSYRFYDDNSVLLSAEYRYEVFSGLDMALFVDGGKVFHKWSHWNLHQLESDVGFGFRFNVHNNVFLRLDTGFSHEGFQIWFKFTNVF